MKHETFTRMNDFNPAQREQVDTMLGKGIPAREVVELIQAEWGMWVGDKLDTAKKRLQRYRATHLRKRLLNQAIDANKTLSISGITKRLNALDELDKLVQTQIVRYQKVLMREQVGPLLLKQVTDEGKLLQGMLVDLGKLQLETGILRRAPKTVTGTVLDEDGNIKTFEWTEEQEQLFKELDGVEYQRVD